MQLVDRRRGCITKTRANVIAFAAFVVMCLGAGALGSLATAAPRETWYAGLQKPAWTPPDSVFGPVWTALYLAMAISGWLVWRRRDRAGARAALAAFAIQLALNAAWSPLFFGLRNPAAGLLDILVLWIAIGAYVVLAWPVSRAAVVLFLPYWAWVSFAGALNLSVWSLNR